MKLRAPHFLLFSETRSAPAAGESGERPQAAAVGYWRFVLQSEDGQIELDVSAGEGTRSAERLSLLAIVRGLEALPAPSRVTVVTRSSWIRRGLRCGLEQWRENHWQWERFGRMAPIRNADLWRRVDRALRFHEVECRSRRVDRSCDDLSGPQIPAASGSAPAAGAFPARPARGSRAAFPAAESRCAGPRLLRVLRHLFSWCGLCRSGPNPVMAAP